MRGYAANRERAAAVAQSMTHRYWACCKQRNVVNGRARTTTLRLLVCTGGIPGRFSRTKAFVCAFIQVEELMAGRKASGRGKVSDLQQVHSLGAQLGLLASGLATTTKQILAEEEVLPVAR